MARMAKSHAKKVRTKSVPAKLNQQIKWEELAARKTLIGGEAQMFESGHEIRGPIKKIGIHRGMLTVVTAWSADRTAKRMNRWNMLESQETDFCSLDTIRGSASLPMLWSDGEVQFFIPLIGKVFLRPKNAKGRLKRSDVLKQSNQARHERRSA